MALDPATHAVRADLADVRLAAQVFAPHYAAPVRRVVIQPIDLRRERDVGAEVAATLTAGAPFDLLDILGTDAWGIAPDLGFVGYVDLAALGEP